MIDVTDPDHMDDVPSSPLTASPTRRTKRGIPPLPLTLPAVNHRADNLTSTNFTNFNSTDAGDCNTQQPQTSSHRRCSPLKSEDAISSVVDESEKPQQPRSSSNSNSRSASSSRPLRFIAVPLTVVLCLVGAVALFLSCSMTRYRSEDAVSTQHTRIRTATMLSVESTAFLPMTAAQVTTYLHVSDPPHASPTDVGVPPTAAETTRMMCGALSSSGLSSIPAVMAYSSLDGSAPYSSVCDSGLYSTALAARASSSCDGAGCRDDEPAGDALYEVNRATLSLSEPRRIAGRWPNAMTDGESVLDALGTGPVVREWWDAVHRGDAAAVAQMNYWHISGGETPRLTYTSPFMEANRTKPSHFSCHIDAARLLDKLRRPEFMESAGPSSRVLLIGFSGPTGGGPYAPKMIACSWCDPSSTTTASPSPSLPCCSGGGDSVVHTALQHVDLDEYMRALGDVVTGITQDSAVPLLEDASGSVYRSNYKTFKIDRGRYMVSAHVVRTISTLSCVVVIITTTSIGKAAEQAIVYGVVIGLLSTLMMVGAYVAVAYGAIRIYYERPLKLTAEQLDNTIAMAFSGGSREAPTVVNAEDNNNGNRSSGRRVVISEIHRVESVCTQLNSNVADMWHYLPDGFLLSKEGFPVFSDGAASGSGWLQCIHAMSNEDGRLFPGSQTKTPSSVKVLSPAIGHLNHGNSSTSTNVKVSSASCSSLLSVSHASLAPLCTSTPLDGAEFVQSPMSPKLASSSSWVRKPMQSTSSPIRSPVGPHPQGLVTNEPRKCFCSMLSIHLNLHGESSGSLRHAPFLMEVVMDAIRKYGGTFDIFIPEMLYISFGSRRRMKDHALRATECGIEICKNLPPEILEHLTFCVDCGVYYTGTCGTDQCKGFVLWGRPSGLLFMRHQLAWGARFVVLDAVVPLISQRYRALPIDSVSISEEKGSPQVTLYVIFKGSPYSIPWRRFQTKFTEFFHCLSTEDYNTALRMLEPLMSSPHFPLYALRLVLALHEKLLLASEDVSPEELSRQFDELNASYFTELMNNFSTRAIPFAFLTYMAGVAPADEDDDSEPPRDSQQHHQLGVTPPVEGATVALNGDEGDTSYGGDLSMMIEDALSIAKPMMAAAESITTSPLRAARTDPFPWVPHTLLDSRQRAWRRSYNAIRYQSYGDPVFLGISKMGTIAVIHLMNTSQEPPYLSGAACTPTRRPSMEGGASSQGFDTESCNVSASRFDMTSAEDTAASYYHENIVQFIACSPLPNTPYVCHICEYVPGGTLREAVERFGRPLPLGAIRRYCVSMLRALEYLHKEKNVIHGLLGPDKVLVGVAGSCKITGMSYFYAWADNDPELRARLEKDAACFRSPEVNAGFPKTPASDIYSFGLILLGMLTGSLSPPWTWAGTPMSIPGGSVELDELLANNKLFIEALEEGMIELKQYGHARNDYNRSMAAYADGVVNHRTRVRSGERLVPRASDGGKLFLVPGRSPTSTNTANVAHFPRRNLLTSPALGHDSTLSNDTSSVCDTRASQSTAADVLHGADSGMLRVLEGALAYTPGNRRTAQDLLQMLSEL